MATEFVTTIKASEVSVGGVAAADVRGTRIAIANVGGTYYAFDDACTHEQCSLAEEGELRAPRSPARVTALSSTCGRPPLSKDGPTIGLEGVMCPWCFHGPHILAPAAHASASDTGRSASGRSASKKRRTPRSRTLWGTMRRNTSRRRALKRLAPRNARCAVTALSL